MVYAVRSISGSIHQYIIELWYKITQRELNKTKIRSLQMSSGKLEDR